MSVESKIKELLTKRFEQLSEESQQDLAAGGVANIGSKASASTSKDNSKSATTSVSGDTSSPMQGSSEKASFTTHDEDDQNLGSKVAAPVSKDSTLPASKGDAKTVKTQAMEQVDITSELNSIFGEDLTEEFKTKASSIFEAAVIARVNDEMEKVTSKLEEQNQSYIKEFKDELVEKVDSYLNYVVETWMDENQVAIDNGLKSEITEQFIVGLKNLFKENYIEIPEDKYDVLSELSSKVDTLTTQLDSSINENVELYNKFVELKKQIVFEEQTKDLAATEVEKLKKLVEGVDFDSDELFKEKLSVIKENYFPKTSKPAIPSQQVLVEDDESKATSFEDNSAMNVYVSAISRSIKSR